MTTPSNGINLEGFVDTNPAIVTQIDAAYSPATGSFPSADNNSTQGNAGLGKNG